VLLSATDFFRILPPAVKRETTGSFANQIICYYEGNNNYGNAFNEALSIDYELCLSALMKMEFNRTEAVKKMDLNPSVQSQRLDRR